MKSSDLVVTCLLGVGACAPSSATHDVKASRMVGSSSGAPHQEMFAIRARAVKVENSLAPYEVRLSFHGAENMQIHSDSKPPVEGGQSEYLKVASGSRSDIRTLFSVLQDTSDETDLQELLVQEVVTVNVARSELTVSAMPRQIVYNDDRWFSLSTVMPPAGQRANPFPTAVSMASRSREFFYTGSDQTLHMKETFDCDLPRYTPHEHLTFSSEVKDTNGDGQMETPVLEQIRGGEEFVYDVGKLSVGDFSFPQQVDAETLNEWLDLQWNRYQDDGLCTGWAAVVGAIPPQF